MRCLYRAPIAPQPPGVCSASWTTCPGQVHPGPAHSQGRLAKRFLHGCTRREAPAGPVGQAGQLDTPPRGFFSGGQRIS